jgi:Cu+-exporting ATPase
LLRLTPQFVVRLNRDGSESTISTDELIISDRIRIKPGDNIPVDGRICQGSGEVDESALTGENQWRFAGINDNVLSGTINQIGSFVMKAEKVGPDSTLQRIVSLVDQVNDRKTKLQRMADRIAARFVWVVLFLSLATFVYWNWIAAQPLDMSPWLIAVSVIIIACPCALGLATPMTIMAATALAFKRRMLIKSGEFLEEADKITDIIFDKTGTLTNGEMQIISLNSVGTLPENEWFSLAVQLEKASNHPIAKAIRDAAKSRQIQVSETEIMDFMQQPGRGVIGTLNKQKIRIGNAFFIQESCSAKLSLTDMAVEQSMLTIRIFVSVDDALQGTIDLQDTLKPESNWLIEQMREKKLVTHLLSGDLKERVASLSTNLGISQAHGEMLPEDKLEYIRGLQEQGGKVIMVGDGLNDAPALTCADIGIAVHNSTELSMEAADVVFLNSNLKDLVAFLSHYLN